MFERAQSIQVASSFHYCRASQDSSQLIRALTFIIQQESNARIDRARRQRRYRQVHDERQANLRSGRMSCSGASASAAASNPTIQSIIINSSIIADSHEQQSPKGLRQSAPGQHRSIIQAKRDSIINGRKREIERRRPHFDLIVLCHEIHL